MHAFLFGLNREIYSSEQVMKDLVLIILLLMRNFFSNTNFAIPGNTWSTDVSIEIAVMRTYY